MKNRPAIVLRKMPAFGDMLVCGLSTQLHLQVHGFDERIAPDDSDYAHSGIRSESLIRLGYLAVLPQTAIIGTIGNIAPERLRRLLSTLAEYLQHA